jgi:hypothetical protein
MFQACITPPGIPTFDAAMAAFAVVGLSLVDPLEIAVSETGRSPTRGVLSEVSPRPGGLAGHRPVRERGGGGKTGPRKQPVTRDGGRGGRSRGKIVATVSEPSLLITFDDEDHLAQVHDRDLENGRVTCPGETDLALGDRCEVVLVHPQTGDSIVLNGEAIAVGEDETEIRFGATPLVKTQLRKFSGTKNKNVQQRMRELSVADRRRYALSGELQERVALERMYGKTVWEALLMNPKLTMPEVARLARYGTLPRPLLATIVQNNTWVRVPQVRRALLANPRLDKPAIDRILRFLPKPELELVPQQTAYPMTVRSAAKTRLKRTGR